VVLKDFSNSRVLDRLLMYERRIEHSLYRTMAELQRLRLVRELDAPAEESAEGVSSLKFQVSSGESQSSILQTSHFTLNTSEETPHGVTTNAPAAGVSPPAEMLHHSNIPSFRHSIHSSGCPAVEDPSCKTNPISPGPSEGQVLCDEGVMNNVAENSCEETKPIRPDGLVVCP